MISKVVFITRSCFISSYVEPIESSLGLVRVVVPGEKFDGQFYSTMEIFFMGKR